MSVFTQTAMSLIDDRDVKIYYEYLLRAFKNELLGVSRRHMIEEMASKSLFSRTDSLFLRKIVEYGFMKKDPYQARPLIHHTFEHPIELLNYIVQEGYTPSSPFVIWAHKKLGVSWDPMHWFVFLMRDIAPVDLVTIRKELKRCKKNTLPQTLEFYYRLGTGLERVHVHPDQGVRRVLRREFAGDEAYRGFDPIDYLDYYYGGLDKEDMTIARTFYDLLLGRRHLLPSHVKALIVGNGPTPDEAQTLAMIPEINTIIPADIDPRNINIMKMHTGGKNPLSTQKARPGEEHADFTYYLFEKHTGARFGFFSVREITAVKTLDPIYVDVSRKNPLDMPRNSLTAKKTKADLVIVPFCPESITNKLETYRNYISNISSLVGSGKHLCMLALKQARFYISGVEKLDAVPIDEKIVNDTLVANGFGNVHIVTIETGFGRQRGFSDSMIVWATKK
ncbi:MAG: hypothetical protein AABY00_00135 [Nanoarchaeota archaeon]